MYDPQLDDAEDSPERVPWRPAAHPILVGVAGVALAFGAWHGLLWTMDRPLEEESTAEVSAPRPDLSSSADTLVPSVAEVSRSQADSAPDRGMSPFRRSHPWAAVPGQPYYYPSRCPTTLRNSDLLFFRTQAEAQAGGFMPAPNSGCG